MTTYRPELGRFTRGPSLIQRAADETGMPAICGDASHRWSERRIAPS